ncbi:Wadjet anti-phage system protein JetD domain-containing protein [Massilia sp. MP_M2]|uniref:Wadjet anti-phage system protein JetD domain-containing protein n=1 Tax=Massilia sp. MP_M2 TaxID=3071713 RepID=UPI00319DC7FF
MPISSPAYSGYGTAEADALRMIGRVNDARRFDALAAITLASFPLLRTWVSSHPLKLLEHGEGWERILAVLHWFVAHPRPAIYLRQLDTHGVDTKFIEARKGLFAELLDQVLPPEALSEAIGPRQFEARYGLLGKPPLIRFRMLDEAHYIAGLSDLTVPVTQSAMLRTGIERVFVTENEINALAFPQVESGMVVFGGGYGIDRLTGIDWLRDRDLVYWGDIDTHGFAILDRLRAAMPTVRSLLMDAATLQAHRHLWGSEDADKRFTGNLTRLTVQEQALFTGLRDNVLGERLRLEQERLAYGWVSSAIKNC